MFQWHVEVVEVNSGPLPKFQLKIKNLLGHCFVFLYSCDVFFLHAQQNKIADWITEVMLDSSVGKEGRKNFWKAKEGLSILNISNSRCSFCLWLWKNLYFVPQLYLAYDRKLDNKPIHLLDFILIKKSTEICILGMSEPLSSKWGMR